MECYVFSSQGLDLGRRLIAALEKRPWQLKDRIATPRLHAPARLAGAGINAFSSIRETQKFFRPDTGQLFIGATGIAVRTIAPLLKHKSMDPPVVVMDAAGQFVISLLSGHLGGANDLAVHIAKLLGAIPVITTASDSFGAVSLDILLRDANIRIVDWQLLAKAQASILEGKRLPVWDPAGYMPENPVFYMIPGPDCAEEGPLLAAHWKRLDSSPNILRLAPKALHIGIGFRKNVSSFNLENGIREIFDILELEPKAVAALATVDIKAADTELMRMASTLGLEIRAFPAEKLAGISTPNPSNACGKFFGLPPFSVCEAAALASATCTYSNARLFAPKIVVRGSMTFAVALADAPIS